MEKIKTLGEQRVSLNPSDKPDVAFVKQSTAGLIDFLQAVRNDEVSKTYDKPNAQSQLQATSGEKLRLIALAQTAYEEAVGWAEKALNI